MNRDIFLTIDTNECHACKRCLAAPTCILRAIQQIDPGEPPYIDVERCRDCRICLSACPFGAIVITK